ncbi:uncharacterized protein LOC129258002 [Lytechinus pictus]|uniref:uncharacterized protein LOC129258002 n=1 Tax=Lytechinus pictus TaxID=7653 RepID=UPI0030B9C504
MAAAQPQGGNLPDQAEFEGISLTEIGHRFKYDIDGMVLWCRNHGLLATHMDCPTCGRPCREGAYNRAVDGITWRCANPCRKTVNIRKDSFFERSHLQLWQIVALSYVWSTNCGRARGLPQDIIMKEVGVSNKTTVDWMQFFRDICVQYFQNHQQQIGGPGVLVEIDESLFARRKNNVGRARPEKWVLGGYEPARKIGFLVEVQQRDAATLLPIIQQWVAPGSIIWTDMWRAYNNLPNLPGQYQHGVVNHTLNFVDPNTGVTTNRVESMWQRAKAKFKAQQGPTNRAMIGDYLCEFMWSQRFSASPLFHLWTQIATDLYPVN